MQATLLAIEEAQLELLQQNAGEQALERANAALAQARGVWRGLAAGQQRLHFARSAQQLRAQLERHEQRLGISRTPELLLARFGLSSFRSGQREAVAAALAGRDSLVVMPTGAGKSLCYQLPALSGQGLVVVVSPLIALMADQLSKLRAVGVRATMLASGMDEGHNLRALHQIASGRTQVVLAAPERFASVSFREALAKCRVALFVVDEAHCVAEWGHDFRPDYLRLGEVIAMLGHPPVMAVTATATPAVASEIAQRLDLRDPLHVSCGFDRPNLTFDVVAVEDVNASEDKQHKLLATLRQAHARPAIVYCGTRKDAEHVTRRLRSAGLPAVTYHAGLDPRVRRSAQAAFMAGKRDVVVATNAFGMGVDKHDVRTVVHWTAPASLEAYYQEVGRAGRDGEPARALLLVASADLKRLISFVKSQHKMSVEDVQLFIGSLRRRARDETLQLPSLEQDERIMLSVAERAGAVSLAPGRQNTLSATLTGRFDTRVAYRTIQETKDRSHEAYRSIERFISTRRCRRRQILDFFGDTTIGTPNGRCCDVCEPPHIAVARRLRQAG